MSDDTRFDYAVGIVLSHEGGYSNDPDDPGGETNFGITQKDLIDYSHKFNYFPRDVEDLTRVEAEYFYRLVWWDANHYDAINSIIVATKIFDTAVNVGAVEAHKIAQRSCNYCGYNIDVDGQLGSITIRTINEISAHGIESYFMRKLCAEQTAYYDELIKKNPDLKEFEKGWIERAAWDGE